MTKRIRIIIWAVLAAIILCGAAFAVTSNQNSSRFASGAVAIDLKEYHIQDGTESEWSGKATVMPGEKVSLIPRVVNKGTDCYIRAEITFKNTDEITDSHLKGFGKDWYKADDGFYYYKKVLKSKKSVDIFQALQIPKKLPKTMAGQKFTMDVTVHAIQSKNFTPKYDMAAPWGNVRIIANKQNESFDFDAYEASKGKAFEIRCLGDSKKILKEVDDFFAQVPYLMPGDTYSETLSFKNKTNREINLYFRSVIKGDSSLSSKIGLKITMMLDGKRETIYTGMLNANHFSKDSLLAKIPAGAEGEFIFEVSVPASLNNTYSMSDSQIQWIFSTDAIEDDDVIDTGDHNNMVMYLLIGALAVAGMIYMIAKRRKEDADE